MFLYYNQLYLYIPQCSNRDKRRGNSLRNSHLLWTRSAFIKYRGKGGKAQLFSIISWLIGGSFTLAWSSVVYTPQAVICQAVCSLPLREQRRKMQHYLLYGDRSLEKKFLAGEMGVDGGSCEASGNTFELPESLGKNIIICIFFQCDRSDNSHHVLKGWCLPQTLMPLL